MGQFVLTCMAGVAQLERENIRARIMAGNEARKVDGKCPWATGRRVGTRIAMTTEKEEQMRRMAGEGKKPTEISRVLGISRPTIYAWLAKEGVK
jgi:DNA invertase Pin-like site-specific DNA recombinase